MDIGNPLKACIFRQVRGYFRRLPIGSKEPFVDRENPTIGGLTRHLAILNITSVYKLFERIISHGDGHVLCG